MGATPGYRAGRKSGHRGSLDMEGDGVRQKRRKSTVWDGLLVESLNFRAPGA
jgi:hypothetical protein